VLALFAGEAAFSFRSKMSEKDRSAL
jgi:hypothetical protein